MRSQQHGFHTLRVQLPAPGHMAYNDALQRRTCLYSEHVTANQQPDSSIERLSVLHPGTITAFFSKAYLMIVVLHVAASSWTVKLDFGACTVIVCASWQRSTSVISHKAGDLEIVSVTISPAS